MNMERCEQCGNESSHTFTIDINGSRHLFDSFECAIFAVAPACGHCGCQILGHGIWHDETPYCCEHCAQHHDTALEASSSPL